MDRHQAHSYPVPPGARSLVRLLVSLVLFSFWGTLQGQNIRTIEYFFDNDPGFGNGTAVSFTPAANVDSLQFSISIGSLADGFHHLFFRAQDDSGRWSQTVFRPYYKFTADTLPPDLVRMEYFFDQDPGYGNGTSVNISSAARIDSLGLAIDISSLAEGFHAFFLRTMDQNGKWSLTIMRPFYHLMLPAALPHITRVEYFFDTDPGYGNGTAASFSPKNHLDSLSLNLDITGLGEGFHFLFVRAQDEHGTWSQTMIKPFYRQVLPDSLPPIVAAEYFFDTDPGMGKGTSINFASSSNIDLAFNIDITGLGEGFHMLMVRVQDSSGRWSLTTVRPFYRLIVPGVLPDIVMAESLVSGKIFLKKEGEA